MKTFVFAAFVFLVYNASLNAGSAVPSSREDLHIRNLLACYAPGDTVTTEEEDDEDSTYDGERPAGSLGEYEEDDDATERNTLIITLGGSSHNHSNMRDDAIKAFTLAPSLSLKLPFGFRAGYSADISSNNYNGSIFDFGITARPGRGVVLLAGYSVYSYISSAQQRKANYSGALSFGVMYMKNNFGTGISSDVYLGNVKDMSVSFDMDYTFTLSPEEANYDISLSPALLIAWGAQDPDLNALQLKKQLKLTGNTTVKVKKPKFGILGYAASLPVDYTIGKFSFSLGAEYVMPVNVADGSTNKSFINVTAGITFGLGHWW